MLKKVLNFVLNRKSKLDLDGDGKLESYREEIEGVFSEFREKVETLEKVEKKYRDFVEEELLAKEVEEDRINREIERSKRKQENSDKLINKAEDNINVTSKLKEKLSEFIM